MIVQDNVLRWQRYFDVVFWIGLEKRRDRLAFWGQNLHELCGYPVHYFRAVNCWDLGVRHDASSSALSESRGHLGCYLSHYFILRTISEMRVNALILEDDVKLVKNFLYELDKEMIDIVQDWDVLHLGGFDLRRWTTPGLLAFGGYTQQQKDKLPRKGDLVPCAQGGVWAYLVRWEVASRMADELMERCRHTDHAYETMYAEHNIRFYHLKRQLAFHCFGQVKTHSSEEAVREKLNLRP